MNEKTESIRFETDENEVVDFSVIAQTKLGGVQYLLVSEPEGEEAYILKELTDDNNMITYEMVEDDAELKAVGDLFESIIEDIDLV